MFKKEEIGEFKRAMDHFGWVENCIITPELISFTDKLYHRNWRLFPNQSEYNDRTYFPIHGECEENNEFRQCNAGFTVFEAMKRLDERLWFWAAHNLYGGPDYSKMDHMYCEMREDLVHYEYAPAYKFLSRYVDEDED